MIKTLSLAGALVGALFATDASLGKHDAPSDALRSAQEFEVDGSHSSVLFRVQHLQAAPFWGAFKSISGSLKVDDENLGESFVRIEVATDSVDTRAEGRDRHLKSQDFFSAVEFPTLTFESTKVEKAGDDRYTVTGDLTLRGVTKSISFEATHTGTADISERFGLRSGYEAMFEIDRTDFGISWGAEGEMLGKTVRLIIALECKLPG